MQCRNNHDIPWVLGLSTLPTPMTRVLSVNNPYGEPQTHTVTGVKTGELN